MQENLGDFSKLFKHFAELFIGNCRRQVPDEQATSAGEFLGRDAVLADQVGRRTAHHFQLLLDKVFAIPLVVVMLAMLVMLLVVVLVASVHGPPVLLLRPVVPTTANVVLVVGYFELHFRVIIISHF